MRKFRFAGERALQVRRQQEDDARLQVARAEAVRHRAVERRDRAETRLDREHTRLGEVGRQGAPNWLLDWHRNWIDHARAEVVAGRQALSESVAGVAAATSSLQAAHRRRRMLERWRDRRWARFVQESNRHEMNELNALATQRYQMGMLTEGEGHDDAEVAEAEGKEMSRDH